MARQVGLITIDKTARNRNLLSNQRKKTYAAKNRFKREISCKNPAYASMRDFFAGEFSQTGKTEGFLRRTA